MASAIQTKLRVCASKPRILILTDITNEPDDSESLVRYLLYSNEFDTRGIVACTSTHMQSRVAPQEIHNILDGYEEVLENLKAHTHAENPYPEAAYLRSMVSSGPAMYGRFALNPGIPLSEGSRILIDRVDESCMPLWVLCWGGTNTLAQALHHVEQSRSAAAAENFRSRLRVYAISDQDDTGAWIRVRYPDVFYIVSVHGWSQYSCATWTGISSSPDAGADDGIVTKEWFAKHIQIGPLGAKYPDFKFIPEGDTPTFLYLIQNGLGSPEHPHWGSWGGRYIYYDPSMAARHFADAVDTVVGKDGKTYSSNFATIWRWRGAFQNDFAARMKWSLCGDTSQANHAPVVIVNGSSGGPEVVRAEVEAGHKLVLDASESYDPDGDGITFRWFQYREPTCVTGILGQMVPDLEWRELNSVQGQKIEVGIPPPEVCGLEQISGRPVPMGHEYHLVLEVTDDGVPSLTTYKRVVIQTTNSKLRGGRSKEVETTAEWLLL